MRMLLTLVMDRPIIRNVHYISPGGYNITLSDGKSIEFDFLESIGQVRNNDPKCIDFELRHLDTDCFPGSMIIDNIGTLNKIADIEEVFVYTGEKGEPEISLDHIVAMTFETSELETFDVPASIINKYNERRQMQ